MITVDQVAQAPLFSQLTTEQQERLAPRAADVQLQTGDWLIQEGELPHAMCNELYLRSRTGVRASFLALMCAEGRESLSSHQTEGELS